MATATYKDLCIDASDAHALARFWGPVLDLDVNLHDDGDADLRRAGEVLVWVNTVPEPKTVKNRLHLDVHAASLDRVLAAGARVVDEQPRWTVLADPDGQEFCVFVRQAGDERLRTPLYELVQDVTGDADDAHGLAVWWGDLLGATAVRDDGFSHLEHVAGLPCESLVFQPVPEAKTAKNRVHVDVTTRDVGAVVAAGAVVLRPRGEDGLGWTVLADPHGNEFCAFTVG
ncbi:VOC family protein [Intrasporangium flavum]|uniref:VOC family protein n=1 Tax=Intrasporangium flavum TaxID=1428657 RepID=UPI00096DE4E0|nr:VOC family protein [Intrasporangium flavum]